MKETIIQFQGMEIPVYSMNTVVVGSGAAGLNAADSLYGLGQQDVAIVTEGLKMGTSRNTGSDKQTYYKLTVSGDGSDSVMEMAQNLFQGGCMHGDIALVEAALSTRAFFKLVDIGVPFPHNRFGEYIGYKTDHDPRQRATSAGPLTSRFMTEKLEGQILGKGIRIFDGYQVIGILTDREHAGGKEEPCAFGLIALNTSELSKPNHGFTLFNCTNIMYAVGGPAGMYLSSVYPESQTGASGIAFEAGVRGINLTESQYGLASIQFRWNLSGTYQQVLPRYVSMNPDGTDEREFLEGYFEGPGQMLDAIFLKGYQWPFDPRKVDNFGSSRIDLLVHNEIHGKGRRVYLDFMKNPRWGSKNGDLDFTLLSRESFEYLQKSGALFGTPLERLKKMNAPAIDLYRKQGIDLEKEYLEIAVCAQHNNGGLVGNLWWESNIRHFFPIGEVNGTFGVYRPGGSALNSTQVGSFRAAQYIAAQYGAEPLPSNEFIDMAKQQLGEKIKLAWDFINNKAAISNMKELRLAAQARMTRLGGHIRPAGGIEEGVEACKQDLEHLTSQTRISSLYELPFAFQNRDILISQYVYLNAIRHYIDAGGKSRGSYIISDASGGSRVEGLEESLLFSLDESDLKDKVCEIGLKARELVCEADWKPVRPVPSDENWYENVWNAYRNGEIIK